jgi:6-pyruvoyltetrahydropterin/6-carboxytetrahydropterin synthase
MDERLLVVASARFESARRFAGDSRGLHGHSFGARLRVQLSQDAHHKAPPWVPFAGGEIDALREGLQAALAPLDHQLINERIADPSDTNIARWIAAHIALDGVQGVGVRGPRDQGVEVDAGGKAILWRRYAFESAHVLPKVRAGHKCGRMHGHGFAAVLHAEAGSDELAAVRALDRIWEPLHGELHLACLNEVPGLENPTSENLARWVWERSSPFMASLRAVTIHETGTCGAHYDGRDFRIWKEMDFDSAIRLEGAPQGDPRRRLHGHSYVVRLHLRAPLDEVLGWTLDFGDVKEIFSPVFQRLDHNPLQDLPEVARQGAPAIARWIRSQVLPELPQLERVDLFETPGCGVELHWGAGESAPGL